MNNETLELLYNRKSVRAYEKRLIPKEDVQAILRAAIEALKSPEKEILNMRIHEKKDFPEIAEKLHMSNAAVRSQYRRILKKAQRAWAEDTPEQI